MKKQNQRCSARGSCSTITVMYVGAALMCNVASAYGQCNFLCNPPTPCPSNCNGSGISVVVEPLGIFTHDCTIPYKISVSVSFPACNATDVQVRVWLPNNLPNNPNFCQSTNGILLTTLPLVESGQPPIIIDASGVTVPAGYPCPQPACPDCSMLNYVVNHADEQPGLGGSFRNNLNRVRVFTCANGNSQGTIGGSAAGQAEHPLPIAHPCIKVVKTATPPSPFCLNLPNIVNYSFAVSIPTNAAAQAGSSCTTVCNPPQQPCFGDTPLNNVVLTDDHCLPTFIGGDANNNNVLDLTETWNYTCSAGVVSPTTNMATVMGTGSFPNGATIALCLPGSPLTVTDTDTQTVTPNQPPNVEVMGARVCDGTENGQLCAVVTGVAPPFSLRWYAQSDPSTTLANCSVTVSGGQCCVMLPAPPNPSDPPIVYCAEATDANGCMDEGCGDLGTNPNRTVTVEDVKICEDGGPLVLTATVAGGFAPYTISWFDPSNNPIPSATCNNVPENGSCPLTVTIPGVYTAKAIDSHQCMGQDTGLAEINPRPSCTVENPIQTICSGQTATFTASPHGGTAPYTVTWRDEAMNVIKVCTNVVENGTCTTDPLSALGTYCASVVDSKQCTSETPCCGTLTVGENPSVLIAPNRVCEGTPTGQLCATVSGGTAPYTVQFFNAMNQPVGAPCNLANSGLQCCRTLAPGSYTATVTDALGCTGMGAGTLAVNPNPVVTVMGAAVCQGTPTGQICAMVTGGTPPYTVEWYEEGLPGAILTTCTVTVEGGQCCVNLPPGPPGLPTTYCAIATDIHGCIGEDCGDIASTPNRMVNVNDREVCEGMPLPELCAVVNGGTPPYTVQWSNANAPSVILFTCTIPINNGSCCYQPTAPGTYIANVTDAEMCMGTADGTLTVNPTPMCLVDVPMHTVCAGEFAIFNASASGGTAPYTITWSGPGGFTAVCTGLAANQPCSTGPVTAAGLYCAMVMDSRGCVTFEPCCAKLMVAPRPHCQVEPCCVELCPGEEVTFTAHGFGGSGMGYTFHWFGPNGFMADGPTITVSVPGIYAVQVTDSNGCEGADLCCGTILDGTIVCKIEEPTSPPPCSTTGHLLHGVVQGLIGPYFYTWSLTAPGCGWAITGGQGTATITYSTGCPGSRGDFTLMVSDLHGCTSMCTINIECDSPPQEQGCPPSHWNNPENMLDWMPPYCPMVGYNGCSAGTKFRHVFNVPTNNPAAMAAYSGKTLLQVLQQGGGGFKALGRQTVAALLNSAVFGDNYSTQFYSPQKVINKFNNVVNKNNGHPSSTSITNLKNTFAALNAQGCPLGGEDGPAGHAPQMQALPDLNGDSHVNQLDLDILLKYWGGPGPGDLDHDGIVGPADLIMLMSWWGI